MYGLTGRMTAQSGQHEALKALLLDDVGAMPGCLGVRPASLATSESPFLSRPTMRARLCNVSRPRATGRSSSPWP